MEIIHLNNDNLAAVAKFCRINMEYDAIPDFLFKEKTIDDEDFDPSIALIAIEDDEIVGFMMGVIRNHCIGRYGYIKLAVTKQTHRRKSIATILYNIIEGKFINEKCERIRVYESHPNYYMPGIDPRYTEAICFFERNGFKKFNDTCNLLCNLSIQDFDTEKQEKELFDKHRIYVRRAEASDFPNVVTFLENNWKLWVPEVSNTFKNDPISLHLAFLGDEIVGFSGYDGNNLNTGWFGPMGTIPSLRGKNVGSILLKRCLNDQKKQGHTFAIIPWVGPIPFYMNYCGARVDRIFWRYEKIL